MDYPSFFLCDLPIIFIWTAVKFESNSDVGDNLGRFAHIFLSIYASESISVFFKNLGCHDLKSSVKMPRLGGTITQVIQERELSTSHLSFFHSHFFKKLGDGACLTASVPSLKTPLLMFCMNCSASISLTADVLDSSSFLSQIISSFGGLAA